jgi:uncharacterized protein YjbJ (UPF0337 family)
MNRDAMSGRWLQLQGWIKRNWGRLIANERLQVSGELDVVIGRARRRRAAGGALKPARARVSVRRTPAA